MEAMNVETVKFILDNIDKSNQRLSDLNSLIENYKFQIENVGKTSSLGQEFTRNLSFLKGEKNRLIYQIEELKQHIAGFNLDNIKNSTKESEKEQEKTVVSAEIKTDVIQEEKTNGIDEANKKEAVKNNDIEEVTEATNKDIEEDITESNSDCDYYKISSVAAFKNGKILDAHFIDDEEEISSKVSQLYYEYGNDIVIKLNYDGYAEGSKAPIYENMGWIDLEKYQFSSCKNTEKVAKTKEVEEIKVSNQETTETSQEKVCQDEYDGEYIFDSIADFYEDGRIYNFKTVYKKGKYRIDFDIVEDGDIYHQTYENKLSFKALYSQYYKQKIAEEYGIDTKSKFYRDMDVNLLLSLKEIDKEYGTDYVLDYINGLLNIKLKYDLRDSFSNKHLKLFDKMLQRKVALRQRKVANARVEGAHYQGLLVGAISSLVLITTLGISSILPSFGKKNKQDLAEHKNTIEREITTSTTEDVTTKEIVEKIINQKEKKLKEKSGLGLDDSVVLVNKDEEGNIKYTFKLSKELNNKGNKVLVSDYSDCNKFKVSAIAVCKNGEKLIVLDKTNNDENLQTTDLYDKYGKDIDIELNFDAYKDGEMSSMYENIGWLKLKDFKIGNSESYVANENLEMVQEEIKKENAANSIVEEEAQNSTDSNKEDIEKFRYCNFGLDGKIALFFKDPEGNVNFSQKLAGDAWGKGKEIDAGKLDCDYFKISYMAVYSGSDVLDIREIKEEDNVDDITNSMYQNYGADIDIAFNFNGYDNDKEEASYKYVGWLNINKIVNLTEKMKEQASGNTNTITPKTYTKK